MRVNPGPHHRMRSTTALPLLSTLCSQTQVLPQNDVAEIIVSEFSRYDVCLFSPSLLTRAIPFFLSLILSFLPFHYFILLNIPTRLSLSLPFSSNVGPFILSLPSLAVPSLSLAPVTFFLPSLPLVHASSMRTFLFTQLQNKKLGIAVS